MRIVRHILLLAAALSALSVAGQSRRPVVDARFIPDSIMIGDQFTLEVTVEKDMVQIVAFPDFTGGSLDGKIIEILEEGPVDTLEVDGRRQKLQKKYKLTTFEDGYYGFGHFPALYLDKNVTDTIWSRDSLNLFIETFEIDTLTQTIHDIKRPLRAPFRPGEISGYAGLVLLALVIIIVALWLIIRWRRNRRLFGDPKHRDPPHVAAIKALEILHNQKLWQNNKHKHYYTRLTDILREYMEGRYGVSAMEMTSDEIMTSMAERGISGKPYDNLRGILSTADLVKFAKYVPNADYNENAYTMAYYFVEETKPSEGEEAAEPDEALRYDSPINDE